MVIPGNRYPPPPVFLRGGYAHTRKSIPPSPSFPEGGGMLIPGNSLSTIRKFIHPPPGNLYPPPPVFLGGGVRISYTRRGGYGCPGTNIHQIHYHYQFLKFLAFQMFQDSHTPPSGYRISVHPPPGKRGEGGIDFLEGGV